MCGRARQTKTLQQIADEFEIEEFDLKGYSPKFNLGPTQSAAIVVDTPAKLDLMTWGMTIQIKSAPTLMINIRKEG